MVLSQKTISFRIIRTICEIRVKPFAQHLKCSQSTFEQAKRPTRSYRLPQKSAFCVINRALSASSKETLTFFLQREFGFLVESRPGI